MTDKNPERKNKIKEHTPSDYIIGRTVDRATLQLKHISI